MRILKSLILLLGIMWVIRNVKTGETPLSIVVIIFSASFAINFFFYFKNKFKEK